MEHVGNLVHERVTLPREGFLRHAHALLRRHAPRRTVLEVEFEGEHEHGVGSGVHVEFYSVAARLLQARSVPPPPPPPIIPGGNPAK